MSTDASVTKSLVRTLEDGHEGFAKAAEKLAESSRPELAEQFNDFAVQRESFAQELRSLAADYGDDTPDSGTVAGAVHRGWMAVKDALSGSDPEGVLDAAEQGEDHAVAKFEEALGTDLSAGLRTVVERQYVAIKQAHDTVRSFRNSVN